MTDRKSTPRRAARGRGTVAKRPSGRWQARWTAPDGGRVTRTFPTQRDATAWLAAQETDAGRGAWARPGQETVGSVLDRWTEALPLSPRKPSTVAEYRRDARIIAERIGHVSLSKLTPGHVRRGLILPLLADGRSRRYIRRIMVTLRHALAEARGDGLLATDPLDDPGLRGLVRDDRDAARPERRVLSDAEAARLVEAARAVGPEAFAAVGVAVAAGLRVGEILGLRGRDLGSGSVTVAQAVYGGRIGTPKTRAGERTVRLLPEWREDVMAALAALAADRAPGALIFTTRAGGPLDSSHAARHWLTPAAQAAAVGRLGWHALRHSYVTTLARRGVSPAAAQRLAGHASIAVTLEVYTHLDAGDLDAAVDAAVPALAAVTARGS